MPRIAMRRAREVRASAGDRMLATMSMRLAALISSALILAACGDDPRQETPPADAGENGGRDAAEAPPDAGISADGGGLPATHIFGIDFTIPAIARLNLADLTREDLITFNGPCDPQCPAYDVDPQTRTLYYSDLALRQIHRRNLETGTDEIIWTATAEITAFQIAPKENALYVALRDDPPIDEDYFTTYRVDLATSDAEMILERAGVPFGVDLARNVIWYQRGDTLWRTDLTTGAHTITQGGPFSPLSEIDLGPNGTIVTIPQGSREIQRLTKEGRAPETLIADAQGAAFAHFGPAADPASEKLIWLRLPDVSSLPEMYYAETPNAQPRKLDTPFLQDIRFDSIPDAVAPDPTENGVPRPNSTLAFTPCADAPELDCATLVVPIDPQNPTGATTALPIRRKRALRDDRRLGVITYDYGGPSTSFLHQFTRARYDDGLAGSGVALVDRFDLVAIERRGIEPADPVFQCVPNIPFVPRTMEETDWTRVTSWWSAAHTDCADHPLLNHLSSRDVAADLEALRIALGETKINMVTFSYGTTVAATYATEYPSSVRAIAMISPTRPVQDSADRIRTRSALEDRAYFEFFDWCALETDYCALSAGTNSALEVKMRFDAILTDLDAMPIRINNVLFGREAVLDFLSTNNWFASTYWKFNGTILGAAHNGDRAPLTAELRNFYLSGDPAGLGDWSDTGQPKISIFLGVHALDRPFSPMFDAAAARALSEEMAATYEYFGNDLAVPTGALAEWPATNPPGLNIGPSTAPPALVVAGRWDYATNYEFGQEMVDALANGSRLITFEGHSHSAAGFDTCIGDLVTDYLLDPTKAPKRTSCTETPAAYWP